MDEVSLQKVRRVKNIKEYIEIIKPYYPSLKISEFTIEEIEKAVYHAYIKLIGRIFLLSPENMRHFLRAYLLKYEIMNVKYLILSTIVGIRISEKIKNVNILVEKYLENTNFIKKLIEIQNLEEIQLFMKGTKYEKAIKEGILYFNNLNEVFVLEAFLDRLYFESLIKEKKYYNKKEKVILYTFIDFTTEIYNIKVIYRGISNNIDRNLLVQFLINNYLFLDNQKISQLILQHSVDDFFDLIEDYLKKEIRIGKFLSKIEIKKEHFIWSIEALYLEFFFREFSNKIGDIEYSTIFKITELLLKKEKEIKFTVLPSTVNIIHEKYEQLSLQQEEG